jgi:glycosyltransferase involved in cell wall biosynthesis
MIAPTPYFSDRGCHVRIYEEAKALKARGHEVVIVTYHLGRGVDGIPVVRIPNIPWYRKISAGPSWHKPYLDILLIYKAIVIAKQFKPDIIHAHLHEGAFLAAIAKGSLKVPLLFDCQGSLCGELIDHDFMRRKGLLHRFFAKIESWINRKADYIVTSSTSTAEVLRAEFPEISARLKPLPDAVDTNLFTPGPKDQNLFEELGLPKGKKLLVYLGAMTKYQGVDLLLNALKRLSTERDDFHALLMGYPEGDYVERANELGIGDRITFTGKLDYAEASHYLCLGDIAVSPKISATEANGKLLNYMACGLPCIAFDALVNRELLGKTGVYAERQEAEALAQSLQLLLDDEEKCKTLSIQARNRSVNHHSWDARIVDLEKIYRKMLGNTNSKDRGL